MHCQSSHPKRARSARPSPFALRLVALRRIRPRQPKVFQILALIYLVVVNVAAFAAFARDKRLAIEGRRRVPEDRLLALAFLGGSIGAKIAQMSLRHKIRKEPFRQQLNGIISVQIVALAAAFAIAYLAH
nr:DUF1294 domain-containing protein [Rhodobacter sp. NTK016B]